MSISENEAKSLVDGKPTAPSPIPSPSPSSDPEMVDGKSIDP